MAEPTEMPFGMWAPMDPGNPVLHSGPDPPWKGAILGERVAHCKVYGLSVVRCANRLNQARRGWSGMPGHIGQNDTDFTLLQEELNAPISRPLRPNFAIGPL